MDSDGDLFQMEEKLHSVETHQLLRQHLGLCAGFDGYPDGTTDLGDGSVIIGAAAEVVDEDFNSPRTDKGCFKLDNPCNRKFISRLYSDLGYGNYRWTRCE